MSWFQTHVYTHLNPLFLTHVSLNSEVHMSPTGHLYPLHTTGEMQVRNMISKRGGSEEQIFSSGRVTVVVAWCVYMCVFV
jgi:hypothetical protein